MDLDNLQQWAHYQHLVQTNPLDMVWVGRGSRPMPKNIKLIVTDFDGVLTDNRVFLDKKGGHGALRELCDLLLSGHA